MKIVYCIAGTRHSGGMERVLANKTNWLARHGHEVFIITTDQCGEKPFFALDSRIKCIDLGIGYEENNGGSFLNKLIHYPLKQYKHKKRLAEALNDIKPDITVSMFCNDASFLPKIKDGSKKVLEIHFSRFKRLQYGRKGVWAIADRIRSKSDIKTAAAFDRFIVLTHEDSHNWKNLDNMQVIPNARSFTLAVPSDLSQKKVLAVGRLCHQKGFDRLIDVWDRVCRHVDDWKLQIVGHGEDEEILLSEIAKRGLQDRIEIKSARSEEMPDIYLNASLYVMTSRYEGLPMALLEAQAAGLPIVSFDCKCGPKDIVEESVTGYIVKEGDNDGMAQKIASLMQDEKRLKEMGKNAFHASDRYSEDAVMTQWIQLFNSLIH